MKKICFLIFLTFAISACGNNSTSGVNPDSNNPNNNKPAAAKHIEPETNLTFTCSDTFNETTVTLHSLWNSTTSAWAITAEEFDRHGQKINELKDLTGNPDTVQEWQMNVRNGAAYFAKIVQNGGDQAMFYGSNRNMQCTFK